MTPQCSVLRIFVGFNVLTGCCILLPSRSALHSWVITRLPDGLKLVLASERINSACSIVRLSIKALNQGLQKREKNYCLTVWNLIWGTAETGKL